MRTLSTAGTVSKRSTFSSAGPAPERMRIGHGERSSRSEQLHKSVMMRWDVMLSRKLVEV